MVVVTLEGRELHSSDIDLFQFKSFDIIIVTGAIVVEPYRNMCGHALLNIGGKGGYYIHIAGFNKHPHIMTQAQYETYLASFQKTELLRSPIQVPFPYKAIQYLERSMADNWVWGIVFHNCATFVEKVLQAGGSSFYFNMNCPMLAPLGLGRLE